MPLSNGMLRGTSVTRVNFMSVSEPLQAGLYVVATPIGNRLDLSPRALATLQQADHVLAEDTRHSRQLLDYYGIDRQLVSLHEHNEDRRIDLVRGWINNGAAVALVSDAGTPLISDPGYPLVATLRAEGLDIRAVPGPSAVIATLSISGLPADHFQFAGFLSSRRGERERQLADALAYPHTSIFYESPRRLGGMLNVLAELAPDRRVVLCRELTKRFETVLADTAATLRDRVQADANQQRGELVVLLQGAGVRTTEPGERIEVSAHELMQRFARHLPPKKAAGEVAELTGASKNALYKVWLDSQNA